MNAHDPSPDSGLGPLAAALLREHHDIDRGIELFIGRSGDAAPGSISEWAAPLQGAMEALRRHIYLEEEIVFPPMRKGGMAMALMVMAREHGELWRAMDELDARLAASGDSDNAEENRDSLIEMCRDMLSALDSHNSKEEPVIYPHIDAELDAPAQQLLSEMLERGTLPAGWVCEAVR